MFADLDPSFHELRGADTPLSISAWSSYRTHPTTAVASSDSESDTGGEKCTPQRSEPANQPKHQDPTHQPGQSAVSDVRGEAVREEAVRGQSATRPHSAVSSVTTRCTTISSSSLVDDPSLLEEMDIQLPETFGPGE